MNGNVVKIFKKINESAGIALAAYGSGGELLYRSNDSFPASTASIYAMDSGDFTLVTLSGGITAAISGRGEAVKTFAAIIKATIDGAYEPKREIGAAEKFRLYLNGELGAEDVRELTDKYSSFDGYVLTLVCDNAHKLVELRNFLDTMREQGDIISGIDDRSLVYIKSCGEDDDYRSANDFAFTLYDNIKEELRIEFVINVGGTVHAFEELVSCFSHCALAYEFGKMMNPNGKVYSYKEHILIKMLSDLPLESLGKYLETLLEGDSTDILDDPELINTAEEFLKNSLNVSETSRSMYMHRNTLIYRLDKIEKATGLNLRYFNDAVAFRLLTVLNKLVKNKISF